MHLRDNGRRRLAGLALVAAVALTTLAACEDGAGDLGDTIRGGQETTTPGDTEATEPPDTEPPDTEPPDTEPPDTEPPDTEPPATEAPDTGGDGDDLVPESVADGEGDGVDWGRIAAIGAIVLAILLVLWLLARLLAKRSSENAEAERRIAHLVGGAQWVYDQASLELMSGTPSPDRLRASWMDTRRRVNDLVTQASEMAVTSKGDLTTELRDLSSRLNGLQGALDTHVDLRLQESAGDPNAPLVLRESGETVNLRRHELRAAISPLSARV